MQTLQKYFLRLVKQKTNIRIKDKRNPLSTGNTACNLAEHYHHSKHAYFGKDLLLIPIEILSRTDDKNISTAKKRDSSKKEKDCQNRSKIFIPHGINKR